ncbi:MAG: carboxypeptidase-like regulatory domain-containing protein, partial [Candidatus Kapaibacterium sp.]
MRTVFALAILFLPISVLSLTAQTGSLKGIVRTADSGKIIVGARVYVHIGGLRHRTDSTSVERDSTRTDERGEFFFAHIPVGSHALIVAAERSDGESPDYHFLAVRIEEDSVEEVVVNLERRKILSGTITQRSESHSFPIYRGIPYRNIYDIYSARTDIADVVALDPNGGRFVPRYYVDHRLISNPFQTLFESSPPELYPFPPLFALEGYRDGIEIPAWGNDLSYDHLALDRVNLRMQSGSDWESISGAFNVRTEVVPLFGSGGEITVSKLGESGDTTLPAVDAIGTGSKLYEFSLLGPIYKDSASFFSFHVAGRYNQFDHYGQNYELYDMSDAFASERAEKSAQLGLH